VPLAVAHVEGDNVLDRLPDFHRNGYAMEHLDTGAPLKDWGVDPIAANAYLGGFGIAEALRGGADVVVTGRVTDASLTAGPAAWWHGWTPDDHGPLAGAVTAGHVIECGAHATGGNFSGFTQVPGMERCGFPIAEIAADGSSVITKHARDGGMVTVDTVTAQLVYKIQGPRYLNPDATVHLETVELTRLGPDRVAIGPVVGSPPPPTAKVAVFAQLGWEISTMLFATSPNVDEKVALRRQLRMQVASPCRVSPVSTTTAARCRCARPGRGSTTGPRCCRPRWSPTGPCSRTGPSGRPRCRRRPRSQSRSRRSPGPPSRRVGRAGCSGRSPTRGPGTRAATPTSGSGCRTRRTGSGCGTP
jgi:hypothetical protein